MIHQIQKQRLNTLIYNYIIDYRNRYNLTMYQFVSLLNINEDYAIYLNKYCEFPYYDLIRKKIYYLQLNEKDFIDKEIKITIENKIYQDCNEIGYHINNIFGLDFNVISIYYNNVYYKIDYFENSIMKQVANLYNVNNFENIIIFTVNINLLKYKDFISKNVLKILLFNILIDKQIITNDWNIDIDCIETY